MKLEICANSYDSAITAEKFGADRIELCSEISNGGITPSYGMLTRVIDNISIPAFVLIRPRSGNFVYSNQEFEIMKQNINFLSQRDRYMIVEILPLYFWGYDGWNFPLYDI